MSQGKGKTSDEDLYGAFIDGTLLSCFEILLRRPGWSKEELVPYQKMVKVIRRQIWNRRVTSDILQAHGIPAFDGLIAGWKKANSRC